MDRSDPHNDAPDGEHESQDRHHARSTSAAPKEAKLVPVKGTGLSGPFIRRPVMTVLLTLSVIVAGITTFTKTNPNDQAVYLLGLMSDTMTDGDLYKYASTAVAQRISILPGVSQVNIYGVQGAIRIKADPAALASRGLTMDDAANAIKAGTVYSGAGQFDGTHRSFVLQPNGQIDQAEGYRNLIVARNKDRSPVYLRDIAEVKQGVQDERTSRFFWVRGFKSPPGSTVVLAVSRQAGANAVEVA